MSVHQPATNLARAQTAWGPDLPQWVRLLASACDASSQRAVADRIGKSGGYVSRILNRVYTGSYAEAEQLVRRAYGQEDIICPLFGPIPEKSCILNRRRAGIPRNYLERQFAANCPDCANNPDDGHGRARSTEAEPC